MPHSEDDPCLWSNATVVWRRGPQEVHATAKVAGKRLKAFIKGSPSQIIADPALRRRLQAKGELGGVTVEVTEQGNGWRLIRITARKD